MKIKSGFILREVAGNYIVVSVGDAAEEFKGVINLTETGAFLWKRLQEETTEEQLVAALLADYNVSEEEAASDVKAFVLKLKEAKLLIKG